MPDDKKLTPVQFAASVKARYPGVYDAIPDQELTRRVLLRYPVYRDAVEEAPSEAQQVASGLPKVPKAATPTGLQPTERALQFGPGGPQFVDVPKGEKGKFEEAGKRGLVKGGEIGAGMLMTVPGIANPAALVRGAVGGAVGGYVGKEGAKKLGAGETIQDVAGGVGALAGGGIGASMGADAWAETLASDKPLSKEIMSRVLQNMVPGLRKRMAARAEVEAAEAAAKAEQENFKSLTTAGRRLYRENVAATKATEGAEQKNLKSLTKAGKRLYKEYSTKPEFVEKVAAAEPSPKPSRIVTPESTPPPVKVTYQDYPRRQLYEMAKRGNIEAGLELIRNPKDFPLPPNFKFLIEGAAKKIPWRNYSE